MRAGSPKRDTQGTGPLGGCGKSPPFPPRDGCVDLSLIHIWAYENGRVDLSGAEAVMQIIGAQGEAARRAALRQMRGGVASFVGEVVGKLTDMLSRIQAAVDFPEEVDEAAVGAQAREELDEIAARIERRADPRRARMLRELSLIHIF